MTVSFRAARTAAAQRVEANSDSRVKADIDKVLQQIGRSAGPHWVPDAVAALTQFQNNRFGRPDEGPVAEAPGGMPLIREAVVRAVGRPVYFVRDNTVDIASARSEAEGWNAIISDAGTALARVIPAVGRIEVDNLAGLSFVGSGWLIDESLVVTNKHVALYFAERDGARFRFVMGRDQVNPVKARIDYREEYERELVEEMAVDRVVWMPATDAPDIAFLALAAGGATPARRAIPLAKSAPRPNALVAVIGYPARDFDFWDKKLLSQLFGDVYDKKRFAPGNIIQVGVDELNHDCTTLGGNSGSLLVDLNSGEAVGLHYAGIPLVENRAVTAAVVAEALRRARSQPIEVVSMPSQPGKPAAGADNTMKVTIPIEITIAVGGAVVSAAATGTVTADVRAGAAATIAAPGATPTIANPTRQQVEAAAQKARDLVGRRDGVVAIRPGYRFTDGAITDQRAVVIAVENKQSMATLLDRGLQPLPTAIDGVPVDVTNATLEEVLARAGVAEAPAPRGTNYQPRTGAEFSLDRVKAKMKATLHTSPDSGWANLEPFLRRTRRRLTVGMYDFTAPHIVDATLQAIAADSKEMLLVIQKGEDLSTDTKKDDIPDEETVRRLSAEKQDKFAFTWASIRFVNGIVLKNPTGIFDSSYHIKVAVRDGKEFWLSSGNWQSSNQPPHDPRHGDQQPAMLRTYNREWHAIVEHEGLAGVYEAHLKRDYQDALEHPMPEAVIAMPETFVWVPAEYFEAEEAPRVAPRYFDPLVLDRVIEVQPLLTPDNYADRVAELIAGAQRSIYFQNQSFKIRSNRPDAYDRLLRTLKEKQDDGLDVRIIFRPFQDIRQDIENLKDFGFNVDRVRQDKKCHNKGIVVDSRAAVLGSHNWTNAGTCYNRDASLIFHDREVAEYFEKIYLYDWSRARPPSINENVPAPRIASPDEATPYPGMVKVRLADLMT